MPLLWKNVPKGKKFYGFCGNQLVKVAKAQPIKTKIQKEPLIGKEPGIYPPGPKKPAIPLWFWIEIGILELSVVVVAIIVNWILTLIFVFFTALAILPTLSMIQSLHKQKISTDFSSMKIALVIGLIINLVFLIILYFVPGKFYLLRWGSLEDRYIESYK